MGPYGSGLEKIWQFGSVADPRCIRRPTNRKGLQGLRSLNRKGFRSMKLYSSPACSPQAHLSLVEIPQNYRIRGWLVIDTGRIARLFRPDPSDFDPPPSFSSAMPVPNVDDLRGVA
jgi:hypothetical protein